jgi:drug/metabolite transporter (DMT)-like permease
MADRRALGVALALTSATSFGVMPVFTKIAYDDGADTSGVLSARFTCAAAVLLVIALARRERLPRGRQLLGLAALGGIGYAVEATAYFEALERISAGLTALLLYLYPALVVVLSAVFLRHRPTRTGVVCVAVATVGTALTVGPVAGGQAVGVLLGLAAAASYAVYIVVGSRLTSGVGPFATSAVVMGAAGLVYDVRALTGASYPQSTSGWLALAGVTLVGTVIAVAAFFGALALLGPPDTAVVSTVEPVVSVSVAVVVLDESLTALQLLGGLLVVTAVVVLARSSPEQAPASADKAAVSG